MTKLEKGIRTICSCDTHNNCFHLIDNDLKGCSKCGYSMKGVLVV